MTARKRQLKQDVRSPKERQARDARIAALVQAIKIDAKKFKQAMTWSERHFRECIVRDKSYPFPDPLSVVEYLAGREVDTNTLIAAALFPIVSPTDEKDFSAAELTAIGKTFGSVIQNRLLYAVKLDALKLLPLKNGAKQTVEQQLYYFRRAEMQVCKDPQAFALRSGFRVVGMMEMHNDGIARTVNRQEAGAEAKDVKETMAPVAYRMGFENISYDMRDWASRLENPGRYARVKAKIAGEMTPEDRRKIEEKLNAFANQAALKIGVDPKYISVKLRDKSVDSTTRKTRVKKQGIHQLGDLWGFQTIIDETIYLDPGKDFKDHTKKRQREIVAMLGQLDLKVWDLFTEQIGRNSNDPILVDLFSQLATIDPDPDNPGQDARRDDYINNPKDVGVELPTEPEFDLGFGYSAAQDTYGVQTESGKLFVLEGQFLDGIRKKNNDTHPLKGHVAYKTGIVADDFFRAWQDNAQAVHQGREIKPGVVIVYNEMHEMFELPANATVQDYAKVIFGKDKVQQGIQAYVDNDDPTARRSEDALYGSGFKLVDGDRISLVGGPA